MPIPDGPTVGVFVPAYNCEEFLPACLDSVLEQTYPPSQVVVCDDASTDGTRAVIKEYERRYPSRVEGVFHDQNRGIAANLNSGLRRIETDLVSLIAGDDSWRPKKIEYEVEEITSKEEIRWVYSGYQRIDAEGNVIESPEAINAGEGDIMCEILVNHVGLRNWMAEKSLIEEVGYFDESMEMGEDVDYKVRLSERSKIGYSEYIGVRYRRVKSSKSFTRDPLDYVSSVKKLLKKNKYKIENMSKKNKNKVIITNKKYINKAYKKWAKNSLEERSISRLVRCLFFSVKHKKINFALRGLYGKVKSWLLKAIS
ncbi:glycosyltransferase family 2 protein [Salinibacter ruber]|jgi:glycosyltransferase involved in cell wall biosynthesis|uniref:glycosyltransferase family 2 protein n=1 Tax=Salinibacter ruber TaxID=146919 RepID=UPI00160CB661|nr:glycosyltransferase family A protein [Salinibacter ruber]MBB4062657.1 glycosyltransferase involved in cell wall biosynthesis [Salinibacter ruber]